MKIPTDSMCAHCALCKDMISIVDFDMETGKIEILYLRGICGLGHENGKEKCIPKEIVGFIISIGNTLVEFIRILVDVIMDAFSEIYEDIIRLKKESAARN